MPGVAENEEKAEPAGQSRGLIDMENGHSRKEKAAKYQNKAYDQTKIHDHFIIA